MDSTWCHSPAESPPPGFSDESIIGSQVEIARWISHDGKSDTRRLRTKAINGVIWVRKHHYRQYEVFFRHERDLRRAIERIHAERAEKFQQQGGAACRS